MIAVKTSNRNPAKSSQRDRPADGSAEAKGDFVSNLKDTAQQLADRARDVVIERPGTCLAVGFLVGGVAAWLMSKRR